MTARARLTAAQLTALAECAAVPLPADPPRLSEVAFWRPDGAPPLAGAPDPGFTPLRVVLPVADGAAAVGEVAVRELPSFRLPVGEAVPVLTRARASGQGSAAFWGHAVLVALQLAARGRLLPGLTAGDHDAWRLGPLEAEDVRRLTELTRAMPPHAHAHPLPTTDAAPRLPEPAGLLRAFLTAVADGLPRSPAAAAAAGGPAFAAPSPRKLPDHRAWSDAVAAGHDAGVGLSLRVEAVGPEEGPARRLLAVVQAHSLADAGLVADAARLWDPSPPEGFGVAARREALLTLRRAAAAWPPLEPLLRAAVPDTLELSEEETAELLGAPATAALSAAGVEVHWPRSMVRRLTAHAEVGPGPREAGGPPSLLSPDALLRFDWRFTLDGEQLTREELHRLAEAGRPAVRLRDRWVLVDPADVRRALERRDTEVRTLPALRAVLSGRTGEGGDAAEVRATGWLATLRERLTDPDRAPSAQLPPPDGLDATLRGYQREGVTWLHRLTSLGLGCVLADDMGLGKTLTLIALHLHRAAPPHPAGPTLVVCPTSLLANWEREIARFAPGTAVRRHHGTARDLASLPADGFVLTTYGTLRRDADRLAGVGWGLLVADEAQHVKNPRAATARAIRSVPAAARVALTGTPVENNLTELWALLDWATPGLLGPLAAFRSRWADAAESGDDPEAARRLAALVGPFLLRRRKADPGIAPELPPKTETDRVVALGPEQLALYEAVVREGLDAVAGASGTARRGLVVKLLTALKQICNHPAQYLKERDPVLAGRSGKLELLDELVATIRAEGGATLVFTQYVAMARLLERHLAERGTPTLLLHGGTPVRRREEMVRTFQEGGAPVFLLSLKAAGTGLNLTRAEHVVHYDRWWNPAVEEQATDRAYRIGQDRPVQVHRLIAEGTVEDRIAALLRRKQRLADAVLSGGSAALTELSDAELADLVLLREVRA
ncbi:DEAD/DEAH box helicase [Streptomyces lonarensis]|uniref:DEAD/DEAH box helicase n=1 Tax=Streptomyces lonarensis TaxID=700599 RepID=A0A7X6D2P7_9ACTN|nr:DEAD/DEAH box helicase [Streptomyces lonarensis]